MRRELKTGILRLMLISSFVFSLTLSFDIRAFSCDASDSSLPQRDTCQVSPMQVDPQTSFAELRTPGTTQAISADVSMPYGLPASRSKICEEPAAWIAFTEAVRLAPSSIFSTNLHDRAPPSR